MKATKAMKATAATSKDKNDNKARVATRMLNKKFRKALAKAGDDSEQSQVYNQLDRKLKTEFMMLGPNSFHYVVMSLISKRVDNDHVREACHLPRSWKSDPMWKFVSIFKTRTNIKIERTNKQVVFKTPKQIENLLGKKAAKSYMANQEKKKHYTVTDGVKKYGWSNDIQETLIEKQDTKQAH